MVAASSAASDITCVAVSKALLVRVHDVRFEDHLVCCLEFWTVLTAYLESEKVVWSALLLLILLLLLTVSLS